MFFLLALSVVFLPCAVFSQPDIQIEQQIFEYDIGETFEQEFSFNLSNQGNEDLLWHSRETIISVPDRVGPDRDEPGDVLGRFRWLRAGQNSLKAGIAFDPGTGYLILTSFQNNFYGIVDPANGYRVVREWQAGQALLGATCLNGIIYAVNSGHEWLQKWDIEGNDLGHLNTGRLSPVTVTASNEADLLIFMDFEVSNSLNVMTPDGEIIGTIGQGELFDDNPLGSIVWVDNHHEGPLWFVSRTNHRVFQLSAEARAGDQVNPQVIQSFDMPEVVNPHELDGIGHDGKDLVFGIRGRAEYILVDDGMGEQYWLTWAPKQGRIAPEEDMDIFGLLNMAGMIEGDYAAEIHIYSNDPNDPDMILNLDVHVNGFPEITVSWPESAGFPEVIDFNDYNHDVWTGYTSRVPLTVENVGTADIQVDSISFNNQSFFAEPSNFVVVPGEEIVVSVLMNAPDPGENEGLLVIISNDEDEPEISIPIRGRAADPPVIRFNNQNFELQPEGNEADCLVEFGNEGASLLEWRGYVLVDPEQNPNDSGETIVTVDPSFGNLEQNENARVSLRFDRANNRRTVDHFNLILETNDPANEIVTIEITIRWSLEVISTIEFGVIPDRLTLEPPYPNPFNSQATISFSLPRGGVGSLRLYSLDGGEVAMLAKGAFTVGWQSVVVDGGAFPAGIYLARLSAGNESVTTRVVVLK